MAQTKEMSGGLLAFGLATATVLLIDLVRPSLPSDSFILNLFEGVIVYVLAAAIAGFVSQREDVNFYSVAMNITLLASLLNLGLMILVGSITGFLWIVLGYLVGGLLGGLLRQLVSKDAVSEGESTPVEPSPE